MTFLDTSYLAALFMRNDQWHQAARRWTARATPPLITTDYVILELADGLARPEWRAVFLRIRSALQSNPHVQIVAQSRALLDRGVVLYAARMDKSWSLTDCLSFVVMQDEGCTEALTADLHFAQAGFRVLLREA
ncbi:MAG: PIN domain-containing protein [Phycisphaerae bacterium]